jgi:linoleoyl-CoA desaturase
LAHTIEGNTFPKPDERTGNIENEWAIHQVETTVDFAPQNKLAAWYLGGLNFQIEHHLFSKICHIHYPAISRIVENTCREFSVSYISYPTVRSAVTAHYRFLKMLGKSPAMVDI